MAALARFIPLSEAARRLRVSVKQTRALIASGKIQGGVLPDGEMVVSVDTLPKNNDKRKEDLHEYKKHAKLKGVGIWVSEAQRKYHVPNQTLVRWANGGIIATLGRNGNKRILNEQDVAYCAEIYRQHNGGQGRWLFNEDGTPRSTSSLAG